MFRKASATVLLLVMAMIITLQHPVLGYCVCIDDFFTAGCACEAEPAPPKQVSSCATDCCKSNGAAEQKSPSPCDDCNESLTVETSDFLWVNANEFTPDNSEQAIDSTPILPSDQLLSWQSLTAGAIQIRGSPPSDHCLQPSRLPIYLKHQAFRL